VPIFIGTREPKVPLPKQPKEDIIIIDIGDIAPEETCSIRAIGSKAAKGDSNSGGLYNNQPSEQPKGPPELNDLGDNLVNIRNIYSRHRIPTIDFN
jgi:hypothetical protein